MKFENDNLRKTAGTYEDGQLDYLIAHDHTIWVQFYLKG